MNEKTLDTAWEVCPRVRLLGQPIGLGLPLTLAGGYVGINMILAFTTEEPLWLQLCTIGLIVGFGVMFSIGVGYLLSPLEKVWVSREEIQVRLGPIVLRRIPVETIHSVSAITREILIRNRDCVLYRMKVHCNGKWPRSRTLWLDWTTNSEEVLRRNLPNAIFLM